MFKTFTTFLCIFTHSDLITIHLQSLFFSTLRRAILKLSICQLKVPSFASTWIKQKKHCHPLLGFTVLFWKKNFKFPSRVQVQVSLSASPTAAGFVSSSSMPVLSLCGGSRAWFPSALGKKTLSIGHHRDQSIVWLAAVLGLESSRSLVRPSVLVGTSARACQMSRQTCNEQTCAKWLVFALNVVHIA